MSLYIVDIHGELEGDYEEICKYEPCEDAVSRNAVIKAVDAHTNEDGTLDDDISIILEDLPSVQPKKGEWIADVDKWGDTVTTVNGYRCSECGGFNSDNDNFCPNCGADMRGDKEMRELEDVRREEYKRQVREREEKERQERAIQKEVNSMLDKIRAEIKEEIIPITIDGVQVKSGCLRIIDKYKNKGWKNENKEL